MVIIARMLQLQNTVVIILLWLLLVDATRNVEVRRAKAAESTFPDVRNTEQQCEPLRVSGCHHLGYNHTMVPNLVGFRKQAYAEHAMSSFKPLLQYGCSSQLRILLCGFYAPMCSPLTAGSVVPPCQRLCNSVRSRCAPVMDYFGYPWPRELDCSLLPLANTPDTMCMEGPGEVLPLPHVPPPPNTAVGGGPQTTCLDAHCNCPSHGGVASIPFSAEDKEFASVWMAIWSVVCCGVTLFTLVSFMLSQTRYGFLEAAAFRYPDRCGVHMVACYCLVSAGYLLRLGLGPTLSPCMVGGASPYPPGPLPPYPDDEHVVLSASCVLVFLLLYYFTNAAAMWWLVLCGCWLCGVWRGWRHPRLLAAAAWMHLVAWGQPALLTITVLTKRHLAPDQLTGTCYPGHGSSLTLVQWVLLPQLLVLLLGTLLLLLTYACLWREHSALVAAEALKRAGPSAHQFIPSPKEELQNAPGVQFLPQPLHSQPPPRPSTTTQAKNSPQNGSSGTSFPLQSPAAGTAAAISGGEQPTSGAYTTEPMRTEHDSPGNHFCQDMQLMDSRNKSAEEAVCKDCEMSKMAATSPYDVRGEALRRAAARRPAQKAARLGIIAMLYMVPAMGQIAALFYESQERDKWINDPSQRPTIEIFMFKIFMSLAPGIMLSLFLANNRVMHSWRQLGKRLYALHEGDNRNVNNSGYQHHRLHQVQCSSKLCCSPDSLRGVGPSPRCGDRVCRCEEESRALCSKHYADDAGNCGGVICSNDRSVEYRVGGRHIVGVSQRHETEGDRIKVLGCADGGGVIGLCHTSTGCESQESAGAGNPPSHQAHILDKSYYDLESSYRNGGQDMPLQSDLLLSSTLCSPLDTSMHSPYNVPQSNHQAPLQTPIRFANEANSYRYHDAENFYTGAFCSERRLLRGPTEGGAFPKSAMPNGKHKRKHYRKSHGRGQHKFSETNV